MEDPTELLVLHALRVAGVVGTDALAGRLGCDADRLEAVLRGHEQAGLVVEYRGQLPGWALTPAGRARGEELLAAELDGLGARAAMEAAYARFLDLNTEVLQVCSDWQVVAGSDPATVNEHADADYDRAVLERLDRVQGGAVGLLGDMSRAVPRFAGYRSRLDGALARAHRGGVDWVTRPVIDSYHTVWFELHEDLLATLGRSRSEERGANTRRGERR